MATAEGYKHQVPVYDNLQLDKNNY